VAGKIGEFVEDHRGRLVGVPFPLPTWADVWVVPGRPGVSIDPSQYWKTRALCTAVLRQYEAEHLGVHIRVESTLDSGKGCGVSTTSMRAAAAATATSIGVHLDPNWLARTTAAIEPCDAYASDGSLLIWDFRHGRPLSPEFALPYGVYLGAYPLDKTLDTEVVDMRRPRYTATERQRLRRIFAQLPEVLQAQDLAILAILATWSAELNQHYFPKPELPLLRTLQRAGVLLGFWVAHSGVAVGGIAAPHRFAESFAALAEGLGPGYRLFGFEQSRETDGVPFLSGCGRRLLSVTT
jgi:uncharacterized protein involved in propanediol utilization